MRGAGVEVEVVPRQPEHLGDAPSLKERERHGRAESVVLHGGQQRPSLVPLQCHTARLPDPDWLDGAYGVAHQRAHLHGLVDDLGERLAMVPHGPRRQLGDQLRLPLRDRPVVEILQRQIPEHALDAADPILGPRRRPHVLLVHVVQPPLGQAPDRPQRVGILSSPLATLLPPIDRLPLGLGRRGARALLPRHPPRGHPSTIGTPVDRAVTVRVLTEDPHALGRVDPLPLTTRRHEPRPSCRIVSDYASVSPSTYSRTASPGYAAASRSSPTAARRARISSNTVDRPTPSAFAASSGRSSSCPTPVHLKSARRAKR